MFHSRTPAQSVPVASKLLKKIHFVCYKWGDLYGPEYVNKLLAAVSRHCTVAFEFHCITDDARGIDPRIKIEAFPQEALQGNGPKIYTFAADFLGLTPSDWVVSLDLDIVIVGNVDFLAEDDGRDFVIARHRSAQANSRGHGAVYRLRVGSMAWIWDQFIADTQGMGQRFSARRIKGRFSEQRYLEHCLPGEKMAFFEEGKVIIFRVDCKSRSLTWPLGRLGLALGLSLNSWGMARLPGRNEAIVSFSGTINPAEIGVAPKGYYRRAPFVRQYWV